MTRSKLSGKEQQEVIRLFRESTETIAELARLYGVSSSTIRRMVKRHLSDEDYDRIVAAKQSVGRRNNSTKSQSVKEASAQEVEVSTATTEQQQIPHRPSKDETVQEEIGTAAETAGRRKRRRSSAPPPLKTPRPVQASAQTATDLDPSEGNLKVSVDSLPKPARPEELAKLIEEIEHDLEDDAHLSGDEVDEDPDLEDFSEDDEDDLEAGPIQEEELHLEPEAVIKVHPLEEASLSRACYLVIDRSAELVTRPLKSFADLGQIPEEEGQSSTLPVFDNHRMARRFSQHSQRILKLPNGNLIKKACTHLYAKGITRLLINGQVYGL